MSDKVKTDSTVVKRLQLLEKAKTLPTKSGCYLFKKTYKNSENIDILYVGKAKNLRARVSSYFNNSIKTVKTEILVNQIDDFDFIITENEAEAFILENNLIKKHYPKYNIRLKDDKTYPYVWIDQTEVFARPVFTRKPKRGARQKVFGPFATGSNIYEVIRTLNKLYKLRDCSLSEFKKRKRPCLMYDIKQCSAPCVSYIDDKNYQNDLDKVISFFNGSYKKILKEIEQRMYSLAESEEFEAAALVRDQLLILTNFTSQSFNQSVETSSELDVDIIAYTIGDIEIDISCYLIRKGIVLGHKNFHFPKGDDESECEEIFMNFIFQYYSQTMEQLPDVIVHGLSEESNSLLHESINKTIHEIHNTKIKVETVSKKYDKLYQLTLDHAREHQRFRNQNQDSPWIGLNKLKELLSLKETPRVLECYDIAIWQGSSPTASQIVFTDGVAEKKKYRYYALEERAEGNNDFAMMKEVLGRRLKQGSLPDVFIVDGGKGQVNSFLEVLKEYEIEIPVVGIAKERSGKNQTFQNTTVNKSDERLVIPNRLNPYILSKCPSLMRIVVQMRDEAHRFSRKLHHKKEKDRIFSSWLDNINGIGPKTKQEVLKNMDFSLEELKQMEVELISEKLKIKMELAQKIKDYFESEE